MKWMHMLSLWSRCNLVVSIEIWCHVAWSIFDRPRLVLPREGFSYQSKYKCDKSDPLFNVHSHRFLVPQFRMTCIWFEANLWCVNIARDNNCATVMDSYVSLANPIFQHKGVAVSASGPRPRVRARRGQATDPHSIAERVCWCNYRCLTFALQWWVFDSKSWEYASYLSRENDVQGVWFLQYHVAHHFWT